jgi:DNA-binding CsgD family transcriptional regulator
VEGVRGRREAAEDTGGFASPLSPRERQVLQLLAQGHEIRAIGAALAVSPDTVRSHLRSARARLNARSRPHAVALALALGEIEPVTEGPLCAVASRG